MLCSKCYLLYKPGPSLSTVMEKLDEGSEERTSKGREGKCGYQLTLFLLH